MGRIIAPCPHPNPPPLSQGRELPPLRGRHPPLRSGGRPGWGQALQGVQFTSGGRRMPGRGEGLLRCGRSPPEAACSAASSMASACF
ncbi:hypothetical protein D3867_07225 [Azospirillum argentinense]|uniref:Uncharacterized protein n=1 Tax=Azospirillum brasilense TaxID=192 RepID=A0A4D8Q189_AZOBR|nr:hypothetical protein D3867_07225 [Azospirillum argentinense]